MLTWFVLYIYANFFQRSIQSHSIVRPVGYYGKVGVRSSFFPLTSWLFIHSNIMLQTTKHDTLYIFTPQVLLRQTCEGLGFWSLCQWCYSPFHDLFLHGAESFTILLGTASMLAICLLYPGWKHIICNRKKGTNSTHMACCVEFVKWNELSRCSFGPGINMWRTSSLNEKHLIPAQPWKHEKHEPYFLCCSHIQQFMLM